MLPKTLRLSRQGFESIRGLRRTTSPHFSISYGPAPKTGGSAIIVPKKAVKGAVTRHLLKRRVRAIILPWSREDQILIISARGGAADLSYSELENELSTALTAILSK
ncbi:MAG: Ribonuclease protein component [Parcubacteria group bacterium]|nr:Ribonuclease protein component [Parcubacteria group bacterium]